MINSPMNPTGNLLSSETLELIARFQPYIISDEIYHGLVYQDKAHSILEYTGNAFVLNGFSKLYAMTGPGIDFGENGEGYLRFSYANSLENIIEGLNRLEKYIREFKGI